MSRDLHFLPSFKIEWERDAAKAVRSFSLDVIITGRPVMPWADEHTLPWRIILWSCMVMMEFVWGGVHYKYMACDFITVSIHICRFAPNQE
ncbi:unnamed protein product [Allacma fusca]|uniref:Uncharacterized protein n=1 Tax=Allacma fusca TaxID=39272 RepID=A0A8J2LJ46_9HEXA|nr:unnamed protein product [Allacma fusca]